MFSSRSAFCQQFVKKLELLSGKPFADTTSREQFLALGTMVREQLSPDWIATNERLRSEQGKQVYYFSIEFLLGRMLRQQLQYLGIEEVVEKGLLELGIPLSDIEEIECDAGLGNGGLGRLAACFLDSLASLQYPGHGFGIRYKHGLFKQKIVDGFQVEWPDPWLINGNVWEVRRSDEAVEVHFFGNVESSEAGGKLQFRHLNTEKVMAVPYDIPILGYQNETVNTLRLWSAEPSPFPPHQDIMRYKRDTEAITEFLYPDDTHDPGKLLRLKQQYFLVSASLQTIVRSFVKQKGDMRSFHERVVIQLNDTHPVLAIPELMRILLDEYGFSWEVAWDVTTRTFAYTNHTTLSEALETWPIHLFKHLLPRMYGIVEEIHERWCGQLWEETPGDWSRIEQLSILADGEVRMAPLAIVGSFCVNGVAELHTEILKKREMRQFHEAFPGKFQNKTNGIAHRRWLMKSNPSLTHLIDDAIGERWRSEPAALQELRKLEDDPNLLEQLRVVKRKNKSLLAQYVKEQFGIALREDAIFDIHIKRLHAYKRQLLNVLHILSLANSIREEPNHNWTPRVFLFGAKASPGYTYAKTIIKLIHSVADSINQDPIVRKYIQVVFLENYRVSLAERLIPAADVSEQISTASKEASGTGNMKFMMNGALTIGTLDGANVEMHNRIGAEHMFLFGLNAEEVMSYQRDGGYVAREYYTHDPRIRHAVDQLTNGFLPHTGDLFNTIVDSLIEENDTFFVLRDFASYLAAQHTVATSYDRMSWWRSTLVNIAESGHFSSDRTIREYAKDIWNIQPVSHEMY